MKNKKKIILLIIVIITIIITFITFFCVKKGKSKKIGNNSSSQEIVDYILNIRSYEVKADIEVKSNKNSTKYILKQQYIKPDINTQEVLEPSNIQGTKIIKNGNNLKLENTKLNLSNVLENYNYIADNALDLICFIENYKENDQSNYEENENEIIMKTQSKIENKYTKNKKLYLDKNTGNPTKIEIKDINQNIVVYILYKEVKINGLNKQNILAFNLYNIKREV